MNQHCKSPGNSVGNTGKMTRKGRKKGKNRTKGKNKKKGTKKQERKKKKTRKNETYVVGCCLDTPFYTVGSQQCETYSMRGQPPKI